jgi:phosphinothricin tripeptide acetyl hydrolase
MAADAIVDAAWATVACYGPETKYREESTMLAHGIKAIREHLAGLPDQSKMEIAARRKMYDAAERVFAMPESVAVTSVECGGRPGELLEPAAGAERALLYLHGGGYVIGSAQSHRHMIAAIANAAGAATLAPDYRLAPEHAFPAALEDAVAGYEWLQAKGWRPQQITIAGDSAGGGLTLATLLQLKDQGVALPGAAVAISPWTDMTASGASHQSKAAVDPMVTMASLQNFSEMYRGGRTTDDPLVSPLFGDLAGLPPLLIQVGSDEVLLDDAREFHARAEAAGCDSSLEVWDQMVHVWHWFGEYLDEAAEATDKIADFMRRHCPA